MSTSTAITGVRVFRDGRLSAPTTVVIDDGLIAAGTSPDGRAVIDGGGGTLLPGLIDTHVHVKNVAQLEAAATWGVTTVLDMGNHETANLAELRKLQGQDGLPSLRSAGSPASAPDSIFVRKMGFAESTTVSGPADATRFVAERVTEGSDYVKILVEDPKIPGTKALGGDTVAAIVAAAHEAGLMTVAHVVSIDTMRTALQAGSDVVTHACLSAELGPEFDQLLAEHPAVIIPTLTMMDGVARAIGGKLIMRVLAPFLPIARMRYEYAEATVNTFRRAGMVVLAGTDSNDDAGAPYHVKHGESLHEELERLVRAGLTPVEALRAATSEAARVFGLTDRAAVEPGLRADLVLVDGDPTTDISATRRIREVWIGGTLRSGVALAGGR